MDDLMTRLQAALALHQQGRLDEAKAIYRDVLSVAPDDVNALHLLGVAERQTGNPLRALELIQVALARFPDLPNGAANRNNTINDIVTAANGFFAERRTDMATDLLERAVSLAPDSRSLARMLAALRFVQGRDDEARALCRGWEDNGDGSSGVEEALRSFDEHRAANDLVGTIVVPAYNAEAWVGRTLDSAMASIRDHRRRSGRRDAQFRIVVVDDASRDDTAGRVADWFRRNDEVQTLLVRNSRNRGAGYSRNLGVQAGAGPYIWFLDSDDVFFEPHIHVGIRGLELYPDAGFSRTGMYFESIDAQVTPDWRTASEYTYPCNICIRRECHELSGGFPEERPFCPYGPEDVAYSRWIAALFLCAKTPLKTVHYTIREGNVGHTLKERLLGRGAQSSPASEMPISAKDIAVELFIRRRLHSFAAGRDRPWAGPPLLSDGVPRIRLYDVPDLDFTPSDIAP